MLCLYDNVVVSLKAVKEVSLHFIERLKQNTDVDLSQNKKNKLITKSNSAANLWKTVNIRKYYKIQVIKWTRTSDSLPKEISLNSRRKQGHQKKKKHSGQEVCESHLKKGSLGMARYKSRNHRTEVLFLLVISVSLASVPHGCCHKIDMNLNLTAQAVNFDGMVQAEVKPFVPSSQEEQNDYFEFLMAECKSQGGNCTFWTDFIVSDKGINKALSKKGKDLDRPCEYYHRKGNRYERIGCYRPEIVAVCITATLQNDGRCDLLELDNGTSIPICILAEAPSMLGAQQTCLRLGGSIPHPSQWDTAFTRKFTANGENQFWASSDFSIEHSNGSEVDFFVRYSEFLDFKKKCLVAEISEMDFIVRTASCDELHRYVYDDNQVTSGESGKDECPGRIGCTIWMAIAVTSIILLVIILCIFLAQIRSIKKRWCRGKKKEQRDSNDVESTPMNTWKQEPVCKENNG